jgi:hypothetical protein
MKKSLMDTVKRYNDLKLKHVDESLRRPRDISQDENDAVLASLDALEHLFDGKRVRPGEVLAATGLVVEATIRNLREAGAFPAVTDAELSGLISTVWIDGLGTGLHHKR